MASMCARIASRSAVRSSPARAGPHTATRMRTKIFFMFLLALFRVDRVHGVRRRCFERRPAATENCGGGNYGDGGGVRDGIDGRDAVNQGLEVARKDQRA